LSRGVQRLQHAECACRQVAHDEQLDEIRESGAECADGSEAFSFFKKYQPDWVLMDVHMEQMDGLTATRKIKSFFPTTKIVIVTNHTDAKTRQAAGEAGANAFLSKDNLMSLREIVGSRGVKE